MTPKAPLADPPNENTSPVIPDSATFGAGLSTGVKPGERTGGPEYADPKTANAEVIFMAAAARALESVPAKNKQEILRTAAEAYAIMRMCSTRDSNNKLAMWIFGALALFGLGAAVYNPSLFGVPLAAISGSCTICAACVALTAGDKATTQALLEFFTKNLPEEPKRLSTDVRRVDDA